MFTTGGILPLSRLPAGAALSIVGPPLSRKSELLVGLLAAGAEQGQDTVLVTTDGTLADDLLNRLDTEAHQRLTVVDASGSGSAPDQAHVRNLSSPADLTGIAIGVSEALKTAERDGRRIRIGFHSLTNIVPHVGAERLYRLVDELSRQIRTAEGIGLFSIHGETADDGLTRKLAALFDGRIETRTDPPGVRVVGLDSETTEWQPLGDRAEPTTSAPGQTDIPRPDVLPDSLRAVVDRVEEYELTLTLCNVDGEVATDIEDAFEIRSIDIKRTTATDLPTDLAVLQRGEEFIAADAARALRDETTFRADRAPRRSPVLEAIEGNVFGVDSVGRRLLVDASRRFETAAARHGGTLHAGFQSVSRLMTDRETLAMYRRIIDAGVDVHVYGEADTDLPLAATLHEGADELLESWFVVYDGGKNADAAGVLLAIEEEPGIYRGFWTSDRSLTGELLAYIEQTYLESEAAPEV